MSDEIDALLDGADEIPPEPPLPKSGIPGEVEAVWGVSPESREVAMTMIDAWGLERFLGSELHTQAKKEQASEARMAPIRDAFVKAQNRKNEKEKK